MEVRHGEHRADNNRAHSVHGSRAVGELEVRGEMREAKRTPCNRVCDCEWGSKSCMQKRGYIWNYVLNRWSRDEHGKIHRTAPEHRECDYVASEQLTLF